MFSVLRDRDRDRDQKYQLRSTLNTEQEFAILLFIYRPGKQILKLCILTNASSLS